MNSAASAPFAVAVAVGPGDREVERVRDLIESIAAHEPDRAGTVVMVDDAPAPRGLDALTGAFGRLRLVAIHHPRHGPRVEFRSGKGICSAVLLALGWIQANTDARLALKVDTDSLVIGPFADRLAALFEADAGLGIIGAYTLTPNDTQRDFTLHVRRLRELARPGFDWRHPIASLRRRRGPEATLVGALLRDATRNGYTLGEHCMGGGYAVGRSLLDRAAAAGHFARAAQWTSVDLPEDVMMGLHARALGLGLANHVGPGEVFGVRYRGLPFGPEELVARRHAVIHAVKNDAVHDESTIRAFFKARRTART